MIQGYAIYLRTHRETGQQYGGAVWWSNPNQTPEKAVRVRWRREDHDGIRGLFGGFDSKIILAERRADVFECSDGAYHIRIAVDEHRVIESIPLAQRLNLFSPLVQLCAGFRDEALTRMAGRAGFQAQSRTVRVAAGQKARDMSLGIFAPNFDRSASGIKGGSIGGRSKSPAKMTAALRNLPSREIKRASGIKAKESRTGIFAQGFDKGSGGRIGGRKNVESGHLARINHLQWHVKRNICSSKCKLCLEK